MKKLHLFDFDGTLFRNPQNTPENQRKYEEHKGIPWLINKEKSKELTRKFGRFIPIRTGWYGRAETLEPPLVPDPAPQHMFILWTCEEFLRSKSNPESLTLLVTGRHLGLKNHVLRIAGDGGLLKVHRKYSKQGELFCENIDEQATCIFLGENGPKPVGLKPSTTLPWKLWIFEQYINLNPDLEIIEIWEDRDEHVVEFSSLQDVLEQEVIVHHVKDHKISFTEE